jgi:RecA/RadA recombinase
MTKKDKPEIDDTIITPNAQLEAFLKANKEDHFNFDEDVYYKISTGSLNLDLQIGGFTPGLHRLVGPASSGKTSAALEIVRQLFIAQPKSRAVFVRTEGRLSEDIKDRSGLTFTSNFADWKDSTVFVLQSNVYEKIVELMRDLIKNNPMKYVYAFIIDSADGLVLKNDIDADFGKEKVAGAPALTKRFLQKMAIGLAKFGHLGSVWSIFLIIWG